MVCEVLNKLEPEHIGNHSPRSSFDNVMALRGNIWVLDGRQLLEARKRGIIDKLPSVTEAEIEDRSKGDVITKFLSLLQTLQFVARLRNRQTVPCLTPHYGNGSLQHHCARWELV